MGKFAKAFTDLEKIKEQTTDQELGVRQIKSGFQIVEECNRINLPNAGVKALAQAAYGDPCGFCVMDGDDPFTESYRGQCVDRGVCHNPDYMLACVQTRDFMDAVLGDKAIRIYNEAMIAVDKNGGVSNV